MIPDFPPDPPAPPIPAVLGEKNQANPKIGLSFTAKPGTTLRGAWFKTLKRTLVTDQTLEPTQVAGFNQFFDDPSATAVEGLGRRRRPEVRRRRSSGASSTRGGSSTIPQTFSADERRLRGGGAGGRRAPGPGLPLRRSPSLVDLRGRVPVREVRRGPARPSSPSARSRPTGCPLSARFFHPSGWGAFLGATYLKQDGEFRTSTGSEFLPGQTDFWVVDAALRYRLPKRYGFLVAGVNNLTDERSTYQATDSRNLSIRPGRVVYARLVLAFP